jgi:hypothetical protein
MSTGLHGQNGLDPITSLYLIRTFIQPILTYDLEIILPTSQNIEKLETFQRQLLKRCLTLSINTPESAIFIVTEFVPVIAQIERKLTIFNNIYISSNKGNNKITEHRAIFQRERQSS